MADIKAKFSSNNQSITCTITSLTNTSARQSTALDNSSNLYLDALVFVKVKSGASGTSSTGTLNVYAYATVDGGTTYSDGASGTDGSITLTAPPNVRLIGIINVVANASTYYGGPMSVANAFGGVLPEKWGVVIENKTGGTLDASVGSVYFQGVQQQAV